MTACPVPGRRQKRRRRSAVTNEREARNMRTISRGIRTAVCGMALMLVALPGISAAAEQGGMGGMQHGDNTGMKKEKGGHDMTKMGDKAFSGKIGPWKGDARIMDMKAHMEAS